MFEDLHRPFSRALPPATRTLVYASTLLFVVQLFAGGFLTRFLALVPAEVTQGELWRLVTYAFLHQGVFHWLFNMFMLWAVGASLESRWGTAFFARYIALCGVGAALCITAASPHAAFQVVGASGIVFGLLAAFAMVFPEATIYLYFMVPVKARHVAILFGLIELAALSTREGSVATRLAHLGGLVLGAAYLKTHSTIDRWVSAPWRAVSSLRRPRSQPPLRVITDDLAQEVDRALDKVSREGAGALTARERKILDEYAQRRRPHA